MTGDTNAGPAVVSPGVEPERPGVPPTKRKLRDVGKRPLSLVFLGGTVAAVLALCANCANPPVTPSIEPQSMQPAPSAGGTAVPSVSDVPERDDDGAGPTGTAVAPDAVVIVAATFIRAWARPDLDPADWRAGVMPLATKSFAARLGTVNPANVPATAVTGAPVVASAGPLSVVIDVPTDAGLIRVTCIMEDAGWLVANVDLPGSPP
jgi:hypothetical protein